MTTIHISASREYDVLADAGILDDAGRYTAQVVSGRCAVIVSDDVVYPLYGARLCASLAEAGFEVKSYVFPHGEQSKNLETYGKLLSFISESRLTRSDVLVALGGGVVGDLTGFAAATYQRGISFVQVPTTLLAMVDSSVGGKTAVNLETGKNQVGCFYQPSLVLCDTQTLETLPEEEFRCGCAEVIKYALLGSSEFFRSLRETPIKQQLEDVITTCVSMKRDIVNRDEFDRGCRQLLNLGHSVGHAVEACSGFSILHGQAVAIGTAVITAAAAKKGFCSKETLDETLQILQQYGLPVTADFPLEDMQRAMLSDKKLSGQTMNLIVPERIGSCSIVAVPSAELGDWLRAGGIA